MQTFNLEIFLQLLISDWLNTASHLAPKMLKAKHQHKVIKSKNWKLKTLLAYLET